MQKTKMIDGYPFVEHYMETPGPEEMIQKSKAFYEKMNQRRSVRDFSDRPVPREVIEHIIRAASTAPSGAHKQPWTFCIVSDPAIKKAIRAAAEKEEYDSYNGRMPEEWLKDLRPLQTDWHKEFLEKTPYLIVIFKKSYDPLDNGKKGNVYYAVESCGLAAGFLLAAIHHAGLAALTHTPSPMNFLGKILQRPDHEKAFLLVPVGYPAERCWVPDLERKSLEQVSQWY